jgi:hypothetical protein
MEAYLRDAYESGSPSTSIPATIRWVTPQEGSALVAHLDDLIAKRGAEVDDFDPFPLYVAAGSHGAAREELGWMLGRPWAPVGGASTHCVAGGPKAWWLQSSAPPVLIGVVLARHNCCSSSLAHRCLRVTRRLHKS